MITVIILDFQLIPTPRELVKQHVPGTLVAKHYPEKFLPYEDKIAHFFLVGALAFLVNLSLSLSQVKIGSFKILTGSLFLLVFVTIEEGSQAWFPSRSLSWSDLLANYAGVLCFGRAAMYVVQNQEVFSKILPRRLGRLLWNSETAVLSGQQHDTVNA
jgi:VanZ family protein